MVGSMGRTGVSSDTLVSPGGIKSLQSSPAGLRHTRQLRHGYTFQSATRRAGRPRHQQGAWESGDVAIFARHYLLRVLAARWLAGSQTSAALPPW
jgi:hypothetical protein